MPALLVLWWPLITHHNALMIFIFKAFSVFHVCTEKEACFLCTCGFWVVWGSCTSSTARFPLQRFGCPCLLGILLLVRRHLLMAGGRAGGGRGVCAPRGTLLGAQAPVVSCLISSLHLIFSRTWGWRKPMCRLLSNRECHRGLRAHLNTWLRPPATTAAAGLIALGPLPVWIVFTSGFFIFRDCPPCLLMDSTQSYFLMGL